MSDFSECFDTWKRRVGFLLLILVGILCTSASGVGGWWLGLCTSPSSVESYCGGCSQVTLDDYGITCFRTEGQSSKNERVSLLSTRFWAFLICVIIATLPLLCLPTLPCASCCQYFTPPRSVVWIRPIYLVTLLIPLWICVIMITAVPLASFEFPYWPYDSLPMNHWTWIPQWSLWLAWTAMIGLTSVLFCLCCCSSIREKQYEDFTIPVYTYKPPLPLSTPAPTTATYLLVRID